MGPLSGYKGDVPGGVAAECAHKPLVDDEVMAHPQPRVVVARGREA